MSEDVGQCLPLAHGLRHHLLQVQGLAQLLCALLLGTSGLLQGSCGWTQSTQDPRLNKDGPIETGTAHTEDKGHPGRDKGHLTQTAALAWCMHPRTTTS